MALTCTNTVVTFNNIATATSAVTATITDTSLILVTITFENDSGNEIDAATPMTVSGTAMSWTKVNDNSPTATNTRCRTAQYAAVSNGAGSRTFTHTKANASSNSRRMMVSVIEGAQATVAAAIPSGNRFSTTANAASATRSITPDRVGSMLIGGIGDWAGTNTFAAAASNTIGTPFHVAGLFTATTAEPTTQPLASGAAFTWGATTTAGSCTYAVVEIIPAGFPVPVIGISTAVAPVGPFKTNGGLVASGNISSSTQQWGLGGITNVGMAFTTGSEGPVVSQIKVALWKTGTPADNVTIDIYAADGGNRPTGPSLGTSNAVAGSSLGTTAITSLATSITFTFATPVSLSASTVYCFALSRSGAVDAANNYSVGIGTNAYAGGGRVLYNAGWTYSATNDLIFGVYGTTAYYFFGRDGTTATTLQAFKSTAPDTSWASIATKTGFATGVQNISAYQVGNVIHMCITDGATTSINHKYQTFDATSDTFVTAETINSALNTTNNAAANQYGHSIVVRSTGEVVVHYNAARISNRSQTAYRRRTGVATWAAGVAVSAGGVDCTTPIVVLGASDRLHFLWHNATNVQQRHLTGGGGNVLGTAASTGATAVVQDVITIASGTPNFIGLTAASAFRWASADNPTVTNAAVTLGTPVRGADASSVSYALYQSSTDSDLYIKTSSDSGATWGTAISEFVGTVASADANLSKNQAIYTRGSATVFPYIVNDNGTLKYDEYPLSAGVTHYTMPVTVGTLTAAGQVATLRYARALTMPATSGTLTAAGQDVTLTQAAGVTHYTMPVDTGTLTLAGQTAALRAVRKLVAGQGTLTLAGQPTTLARSRTMPVTTGTLTPAGQTVVPRVTMPVALGTLTAGGQTVTLRTIRKLVADQGTLALAGQSAILTEKNNYGLIASNGILTLAGQAVTVRYARAPMPAGLGTLTPAGQPVALRRSRLPLLAGQGALTLSGQATALAYGRKPPASLGTITLAGKPATLKRNYVMPAALGTITLTGTTPNLIYSGAGSKLMPAGLGVVTLAGQTVTLRYAHKLVAGTGTLTLAGQTVTLRYAHKLIAGTGTLTLSGQIADLDADRRAAGGQGILTLAGQTNRLAYGRKGAAGKGQLTLAGPVINLIYSGAGAKVLPAGLGFPVLSGRTAVLRYSRVMPATVSMATLSGQSAALTYTAVEGDIVMPVSAGVLRMAGQSAFLDVTRIPPKPMELKFGRKVYLRRW